MINQQDKDPRNSVFAIMWDCNGLEAVARVTNPADTTFALLKGTERPKITNIMHWQLRARNNNKRHYEISNITSVSGITEDDIRAMFEADPQTAADTIRRIGEKFYSDRRSTPVAIT